MVKMKKLSILFALAIAGCSTSNEYIFDPRASKHPKEIIRDKLECRELTKKFLNAKHEKILGILPFCTSAECMAWGKPDFAPLKKCLVNRGHSILN